MENKFLDRNGLKVLWKEVSLQDYPNNETLIAVIEAIDEAKADKEILKDYLTKEEYVAGESGGSIDLSYFLTEAEAMLQRIFLNQSILLAQFIFLQLIPILKLYLDLELGNKFKINFY